VEYARKCFYHPCYFFSFTLRLVTAVRNLRPAGHILALATLYAARRMIWEVANAKRIDILATDENVVINKQINKY
jgi:hypothetical protein